MMIRWMLRREEGSRKGRGRVEGGRREEGRRREGGGKKEKGGGGSTQVGAVGVGEIVGVNAAHKRITYVSRTEISIIAHGVRIFHQAP